MKKFKDALISVVILLAGLLVIELTIRAINSDMRNYDIEMWNYAKKLKKRDPILGHVHRKNEKAILERDSFKCIIKI